MAKTLKMVSWNVNGIRAMVNKGFRSIVTELNADILCIQETKAQDDIVQNISKDFPEYHLYVTSAEKKGYSGTAIFTREKALKNTTGIGIEEHDNEGRLITLEYNNFYIINVYVPNSGSELKRLNYRKGWDSALLEYLQKLENIKPVIITGDFNVAHQPIDLARPKQNYNKTAGYTQVEIDGITNFLNAGWIDTYRSLNPEKIQYTFWNMRFKGREKNIGWRIDYFLVSNKLFNDVQDAYILDQVMGSDHCPIGLEISV